MKENERKYMKRIFVEHQVWLCKISFTGISPKYMGRK